MIAYINGVMQFDFSYQEDGCLLTPVLALTCLRKA